ncbi:MAG TPA: chloride channel protein [Stellaceae bacterium]|nr:chloride channel protein [Stellaceae bacterium]
MTEFVPAGERSEAAERTVDAAEPRLRDSDLFLVMLAGGTGVLAGFGVLAIDLLLAAIRFLAFGLPPGTHLSSANGLAWPRLLMMPIAGGILVGVAKLVLRRWRPREVVDAIEANALFGGRMSLGDSIGLVAVTLLSGGFGASVGMEAAYTQLGAAMGSRLGVRLALRRDDVRTLVGCGAAAAIAAAFNAPLAGAFYGFELILGSYTLQTLAPVGLAALLGALTVRALNGGNPIFVVYHHTDLVPVDYAAFVVIGLASAGLGVLLMKGVTGTEAAFRRLAVPRWLRPATGGVVLGLLGLAFPQALGSGHGGILQELHLGYALLLLGAIIAAKSVASAVSIGAGYRGGMFSTSLFIGTLFGDFVGQLLMHLAPEMAADRVLYSLVGMGAVAAAIVGAPVTMIMLVLETTGDFSATIGVMVGVVIAAFAVRYGFGYSFATWRFHLRGLKIRSPEDIGWLDEIKVGTMMRRDPAVVAADQPVTELLRRYPPGSTKQVFLVDANARLCGVVDPAEAARPEGTGGEQTVGDLVKAPLAYLLAGDDLRAALIRFSRTAQESLPVVDNADERHVIGYVSEAYALRRYAQELERRRSVGGDDAGIFSPTTGTEGEAQ